METSPAKSFFFTCLLLVAGFSLERVGSRSSCPEPETRCGNHRVRFPFRIIGRQPEECGYPGFGLQCSSTNHPVLELPRSVKLNVKHIDYSSQTVQLYDPYGCPSLHLPNLITLPSPSPFQLKASSSYFDFDDDFTVFNCSEPKSSNEGVKLISSCLSSSSYQVYAISSSSEYIRQFPLLSCTKVFNISSVPAKIFRDYTLHLKWSIPMCKRCESTGRRCGFRNSSPSNETACFEIGSSNKFLTIGGRKITNDAEEDAAHIYYPEWIYNILEGSEDIRIHIEEEEDAMIAKRLGIVGLWCIQWHAVDRPSMQVVVQTLERQEHKLPIPPNPFLSKGPSTINRASVPARRVMQSLEIIHEAE